MSVPDKGRDTSPAKRPDSGKSKSRSGEEYQQLDSIHTIPGEPEVVEKESCDGGQLKSEASGTSAVVHRPSISGSEQGVEELHGAAVAPGGKKKPRNFKHAVQKKFFRRGKRTSSSGESQVQSPERVEADPQDMLESESCVEYPAELEERLREELREEMEAERVNWKEVAETEWKGQVEEEMQKLKNSNAAVLRKFEEEKMLRTQAQSELKNTNERNERNAKFLTKKAKELQDKDAEIKSLQSSVDKLKSSEYSVADLTKKNLKLRDDFRHKEELERLQQGRINTLEKEVATLDQYKEEIDQQKAEIDRQKAEIDRQKEEIDRQKAEIDQQKVKIDRQRAEIDQQKADIDRQKAEIDQQKAEIDRHEAELDAKDRRHQIDLQQALTQQLKAEGEKAFTEMANRVRELEANGERIKGLLEAEERVKGELEEQCHELRIQNGELLMKVEEKRKEEEGRNEEDLKHEDELRSLQLELELARNELKEERVKSQLKVRELEDKLRAIEESIIATSQAGQVTLRSQLEQSGVTGSVFSRAPGVRFGERPNQEFRMKQETADSAQLPLVGAPDVPSNVHQFCLQLSKLVDPEGQSLEIAPLPLSTEATLQALKAIGATLNLKSRGYVVAVFQAYARTQSILLDYTRVGEYKGHEGLLDPAPGDEKLPHTSLGEEKSPYSSLGEVKVAVTEDNMTDSDKWELQEMLKESHEELERLWNHNKILVERLKVMEGQHHTPDPSEDGEIGSEADINKSQQKVVELTERLRAYEQQLCHLPKHCDQELKVETEAPAETSAGFRRLKKQYLNLHKEKLQLQSENTRLLKELEERDAQLTKLHEKKLAEGGESPNDPSTELDRLRDVIEDKEKQLDNLSVQLNTFQKVAADNADLERQIFQLKAQLGATERLKDDSELKEVNSLLSQEVTSVRERLKTLEHEKEDTEKAQEVKIGAERDSNQELQSEVARLKSALKFWESKYPQNSENEGTDATDKELEEKMHQIEVTDLQNKIRRKDAVIQNLASCRCTLESRITRLREERDRYAQLNSEVLAVKASYKEELEHYGLFHVGVKERARQVLMKLAEAEDLKKDNEMAKKEIGDLLGEIEARKVEVELVKQDFEVERKEREDMASRHSEVFGKWRVREQELVAQLEYMENQFKEQSQEMSVSERRYQEDLKILDNKVKHTTHESEQREFRLTVKLNEQTARAVKLQQEMDKDLQHLREERDIMKMEWNGMTELYGKQKVENERLQGEYQHLQAHFTDLQSRANDMETRVHNMEDQLQLLRVEKQSLEDKVAHLEDEKLKNEKLHEVTASMKRDLENNLREVTQQFGKEKELLASKLSAMEQQRKHDNAEWMADRRELEGAIADTSRLSDEVMMLENHLKAQAEGFKAKFQERTRHFELLSKKREEEHREEVDLIRAQCDSEKMEQERLMMPLQRELDQLRSQAFGDGQHSDTFRRMDAEGKRVRDELEALTKKYDTIMDGFTLARELLIRHNIPLPKSEVQLPSAMPQVAVMPLQDIDVHPYVEPPPRQPLPPSADNVGAREFTPGQYHRLSDVGARQLAFSSRHPRITEDNIHVPRRPPGPMDRPPASENLSAYSSAPHGNQQNLVPQKGMLNKADYDKRGGYGGKPRSPNFEQNIQPPVPRAGLGGVVSQGRPPYNQQGGEAIQGHAYDQRSQPPLTGVPPNQAYQQPRYPPPQSQQAMMNAPRPQGAPPDHGHPSQGTPYPPTNGQGKRPPNPSTPQENLLMKDIDTDIADAAAGVRREVNQESMTSSQDLRPLDSNLICPMCKRQFRIGQIQYYKQHVDKCEGASP